MKYQGEEVKARFSQYMNKVIALELIDEEGYPYTRVTTNIVDENTEVPLVSNNKCSFIDTNNNGDDIIDWLIKNNFGELTGNTEISGFCIYPEFEFKEELIKHLLK